MPTIQVELTPNTIVKAQTIASGLNLTVPQWIERVVTDAIKNDHPGEQYEGPESASYLRGPI